MRKKVCIWLLALLLLGNACSWEVLAAAGETLENPAANTDYVWINPMYEDVMEESQLVQEITKEKASQEERAGDNSSSFLSMSKAVKYLRGKLVNRNNIIMVNVKTNNVAAGSLARTLFDKAVAVNSKTTGREGDYILYHVGGYQANIRYSPLQPGKYTLTYNVRYYTTKSQEAKVTAKVKRVLSSLGVKKMTTYNKIKTIYDYICKNVKYDRSTSNSYGKFTAYQAIMNGSAVCQGYASLFYRMAMDAGVRARVMPGESRSVPHAWNIVKLGAYYYNVDSTWDAGMSAYSYFMKSNRDFPDHTRDSAYRTVSFQKAYPVASASYKRANAARAKRAAS